MSACERLEPGRGFFSRRSRIATSSWQSMPSILKTDSAWISQTWQRGHLAPRSSQTCRRPCWKRSSDVLVVERVVDAPSLAAPADDPHAAHQAELVRDRGLADPDALGDLVDAELPRRQGVDDADARRIAEDAGRVSARAWTMASSRSERGELMSAYMSNSSYMHAAASSADPCTVVMHRGRRNVISSGFSAHYGDLS